MRQNNQVSYQQIQLPFKIKKAVLALGSQTKNTLCFAKGNSACLSRLRPDLDNPRDFSEFEREVKYFLKKNPRIIAYDLHPEYQSTKYIQSLSPRHHVTTSPIQHHHAHIASCMAENGLVNQKVIGAAFDGTGLGSDNRLWGAEFF
ncbi:MAG: carbamoyltransferase HypF, partial [Candidatus Omnitrophica bacterium]|nr:carbamoyltransferase HypF [Candidatus Omnitrophota bacterium]